MGLVLERGGREWFTFPRFVTWHKCTMRQLHNVEWSHSTSLAVVWGDELREIYHE